MIEIDCFPGQPTVWFNQTALFQPSYSIVINPRFRSQPVPRSSLKIDPASAPFFTPLHQTQGTVQIAANINKSFSPTARKLERPLYSGINRSYVYTASLFSFFNTCVPLRKHLERIPYSRHLLGGSGAAKRGQTSADGFLQIIARFGHRLQERPVRNRQRVVILSNSPHQRAKVRLFQDQLD